MAARISKVGSNSSLAFESGSDTARTHLAPDPDDRRGYRWKQLACALAFNGSAAKRGGLRPQVTAKFIKPGQTYTATGVTAAVATITTRSLNQYPAIHINSTKRAGTAAAH